MEKRIRLLSGALALTLVLSSCFIPLAVSAANTDTSAGQVVSEVSVATTTPAATTDQEKASKTKKSAKTTDAADVSASEPPSGDAEMQNASTPRVIVTGFSTKPKQVMAGSNFKLVIHLRNTSKKTRVSNMLFTLSAPEDGEDAEATAPVFLPVSGSNSIYLNGIAKGGTADISIELNAKTDLLQKPYSINLSMVYEGANAAQYEASSSLSIPVKQEVRFEIGEFEISPSTVEPGNDANVMCSVYNMGRVKLYNVKAKFEGAAVNETEVFLGNILPGTNAPIDAMLTASDAAEAGTDTVTMTLTYEDETGVISEKKEEIKLEVAAKAEKEDEIVNAEENVGTAQGFPIMRIVIIAVIIIAVVVTILLVRRRRKKKAMLDEEALFDEVD